MPLQRPYQLGVGHAGSLHIRLEEPSCLAGGLSFRISMTRAMISRAQYEDGDANGVASLYTGCRPQIAGHRLDRTLLDYPAV